MTSATPGFSPLYGKPHKVGNPPKLPISNVGTDMLLTLREWSWRFLTEIVEVVPERKFRSSTYLTGVDRDTANAPAIKIDPIRISWFGEHGGRPSVGVGVRKLLRRYEEFVWMIRLLKRELMIMINFVMIKTCLKLKNNNSWRHVYVEKSKNKFNYNSNVTE